MLVPGSRVAIEGLGLSSSVEEITTNQVSESVASERVSNSLFGHLLHRLPRNRIDDPRALDDVHLVDTGE